MVQHRDMDPDHNGGQGSHGIRSWSDVTNEAERDALVQVAGNKGVAVHQTGGTAPGFYLALGTTGQWVRIDITTATALGFTPDGDIAATNVQAAIVELRDDTDTKLANSASTSTTGIVSGGLVTVNGGDPAKFDVAAGVAQHVDPTDPLALPTRVAFGPFTGEDPLDLATTAFTVLSITPAGALGKSNAVPDAAARRTNALLQDITHLDFATITGISTSNQPAVGVSQAFLDYIKLLGAINTGNQYTAAAADLTIAKSAGTTNLPFLNGAFSLTNPNEQDNPAADPTGFVQIYIDSAAPSGFNISPQTELPVGFWDDGSDTLDTVGMNNWAIYWVDFSNNGTAVTIGQAEYNTLAAAESALFTENPITFPSITAVPNTRRTAIIAKGNATDLSNPAQAKFVPLLMGVSGGSGAVLSVFGRTGIVEADAGDYPGLAGVTIVAGTTYTVLSSDDNKIIQTTNGSAVTLSIDTGDLPVGFSCIVVQFGAGQVDVSGGTATIRKSTSVPGTKTVAIYSRLDLVMVATDEIVLSGDAAA